MKSQALSALFLGDSVVVERAKRSAEVGGNDFITKPVSAPTPLKKIDKHIDQEVVFNA